MNRTTSVSTVAPAWAGSSSDVATLVERALLVAIAFATAGLLVYKCLLIYRQNINWDEFYFLSNVYELARGELTLLMLGAYTHLFSWLPLVPGNEISQVIAARWVMTGLLAITVWLVLRLARTWLTGLAAVVPPFVYISTMPVLHHGGSFRFDSMLAPLSVLALVLLLSPGRGREWRDWAAGVVLGIAGAITLKVVLFAPLIVAVVAFRDSSSADSWLERARTLVKLGVAAGITATVLLGLHGLTIAPSTTGSVAQVATQAARKTLLDTPWFPRLSILQTYVNWQPLPWVLIGLGTAIAVLRRRFALAAMALSLLPVVFYRNAFPYYYLVMLAPASVLAGYALHEMVRMVRLYSSRVLMNALVTVICAGLLYQGLAYAWRFSLDDQANQRMLVSAVHQVFPKPTSYVDRCGMISSFSKVNFFMSTWGVEHYRAQGRPFMSEAIRKHRPGFVLVNSGALNPNRRTSVGLLPEDYDLIARFYPKYWGPLRVAGATVKLAGSEPARLLVPFPAEYRLWSDGPLSIDGVSRSHGDVVTVPAQGVMVQASAAGYADERDTLVALTLADARLPPAKQLPEVPLFSGL